MGQAQGSIGRHAAVEAVCACWGRCGQLSSFRRYAGARSAGSTPDSVTIPLTRRPGTSFPNIITVSVGGGAASPVTFDAGSIGLYVLDSAVGPDVTYTSTSFKYGYEDGNRFSGKIAYAPIGFPDASEPIVTDVPIAFGVIDKVTCKDGPGTCPGMGAERVGVMGVRYFNDAENGIFNPFAFLPGNLSSGFMVAANGPTPTVIVGLTPENTQGFLFTKIEPESTAGQGGVPYAWEVKSVNTCFSINGGAPSCDVTSFDTGESSAQFVPSPGSIPRSSIRRAISSPARR